MYCLRSSPFYAVLPRAAAFNSHVSYLLMQMDATFHLLLYTNNVNSFNFMLIPQQNRLFDSLCKSNSETTIYTTLLHLYEFDIAQL